MRSLLDWGLATATRPGEERSGDRALVEPFAGGVLLAVVDGLGHGAEAESAASAAVEVLARHAAEPLEALCRRCHEPLRRTRGVAMALASFGAGTLSWLAVGSVQGSLASAGEPGRWRGLVQRGGTVGMRLPALEAERLPVAPGDTLVLATDGVRGGFDGGSLRDEPPQRTAERILEGHRAGADDALVLVARYRGAPP